MTCPSNLSSQEMELCSCIPNSSYCVFRRKTGNDFDIEPGPEHAFEIFMLRSIA